MKKPKKITAAKPRVRRAASSETKAGVESTKARPAAAAKELSSKRTRKIAKVQPGTKAPAEAITPSRPKPVRVKSKAAVETKPVAEAIPPAKPKRTRVKAIAKPVAEITSAEKPKRARAKAEIAAETSPVRQPTAATAAPATSPIEIKPPVVIKPPAATVTSTEMHASPEIEAQTEGKPLAAKPAPSAPETRPALRAPRKAPARIPAILLEGDKPRVVSQVSGPGQRYSLGPTAPVEKLKTEGELPESYETGQILLTARDPHWLYTHWDLSDTQQRRYNGYSRDGHLVVRICIDAAGGKTASEIHVHPESRHWFVHVPFANTRYVAELGYYSAAERWTTISASTATLTPPDAVSADTSAEFSTIPFEVPMQKLLSLVKEAVHESPPLAQALNELRKEGHVDLPKIETLHAKPAKSQKVRWSPSEWTPAQERALAEVVSMDHVRRVWMGSLEITELIRRRVLHEIGSMTVAELGVAAPGAPTSPSEAITGISSPGHKAAEQHKGFWFNVNAELIVYGATEADASVTIGGRPIKLRPDGSFSYRFALPDGKYEMPVVAISADQTDGRAAEMKFSRSTEYRGDVGAHPQDPLLQQMLLENF